MVAYILVAIIAYLIGSISSSVIISKKMAGFDVRERGSGNAGSTNVLRTVGKKAALITLVCDILKGVVAILVAIVVGLIAKNADKAILLEVAGLLVVVGHTFPVFFKFKGGKGVATSLGVLLMTNWKIGLICLIFALALMITTKMVSLGSISAAVLFAVLTLFIREGYIIDYSWTYIIYAILLAALVIFNHRSNLKRIMNGTENKLDLSKFKKNKSEGESEVKPEEKKEEVVQSKENQEEKVEETAENSEKTEE